MNQLKVIKIRNVYTLNMKMKVKKTPCNPLADPICTCMAMTFACIFWTLLIQLDLHIWSDLEMKCTCIFAGDNFAGLKNWSRRKNKQVEGGGGGGYGGLAYS